MGNLRIQVLATAALIVSAAVFVTPAKGDTPALDQSASTGVLEEVTVTARKRVERAQETPLSLTVFTGEDLRSRSVTQFIDLQKQTPSLHIVPAALSGSSTSLSMRGQAVADIRLSVDPSIAIYQDGVYLPRAQGSNAADLLDIERVEVLSGPQGTLFGKNSTGGAINIYAKTPSNTQEGFVRGRYGDYQQWNLAGMINIPLSDTLAVRALSSFSGQGGWGKNLFDGTENGKSHSSYERLSARWAPTNEFAVLVRGDYTSTTLNSVGWKGPIILFPPLPAAAGALGGPLSTVEVAIEQHGIASVPAWLTLPVATRNAYLAQADATFRSYAFGDPSTSSQQHSGEHVAIRGVSGLLDYQFTDAIALKSLTAYRSFTRNGTADLDGTPFAILDYPRTRADDSQYSEEIQLSGNSLDGHLASIAGVYYSNEQGTEDTFQTALARVTGANATTEQLAVVGTRSLGIFTQHTYKLTDALSFTGGLRWTKDYRDLTAKNHNATFCTSLGVSLASLGGTGACSRPMSIDFSKVNYTAGLDYRLRPDIMVYFTTRRGYRAGGLQQTATGNTPALATAANAPYRPETVTDYELGIKSEWFEQTLRANVSVYHSHLDDAIRNVPLPVISGNVTTVVALTQNAAKANINGVEFDFTYLPLSSVELSFNGSYIDAKYGQYLTLVGEDRSYLPLPFTPKWQLGASANYTAHLTAVGDWRTQVDYSWTARMLTSESLAYSEPHGLLNLRSALKLDAQKLEIAVYGKNLTDKRYAIFPVDVTSGSKSAGFGFVYQGFFNDPRTYGVELTKSF